MNRGKNLSQFYLQYNKLLTPCKRNSPISKGHTYLIVNNTLKRTLATIPSGPFNPLTEKPVERSRRALFNVPGSEERKLRSSLKIQADSIVFDLEDGVAVGRKGAARSMVFEALETFDIGRAEKAVRINGIGSGLEIDDLNVILRSRKLQAIVIPKVQSAKEVQFVARMIDSIAPEANRQNIKLLACIESAIGLMNMKEIATADSRLDALVFSSEDFCADTGIVRTPSLHTLLYARSALVTTACAHGLQSIDLVCLDYKDEGILEKESIDGRQMGFTGKQAIHPNQLDIIQRVFSPNKDELDRALRIIQEFDEHVKKGIGAFDMDGKMVDMPVVKWAQRLVSRARQAGLIS